MSTISVATAGRTVLLSLPARRYRTLTGLSATEQVSDRLEGEDRVSVRVLARPPRTLTDREWVPITRGVARDLSGRRILLESAGGSGLSQLWDRSDGWDVTSWWRPSTKERVAALALPARHRLLTAQILVHYPALMAAIVDGWSPLHISLVEVDGMRVALAGPGGIGKSTLVAGAVATGARAWCDNVAVSDGSRCHGMREAMRLPRESAPSGIPGQRTSHDRVEVPHAFEQGAVEPDAVVVVRRGSGFDPVVRRCSRGVARRALVAGTFAAGELMRLWPMVAAFSSAWHDVPAVPAVDEVAKALTATRPCFELVLGERRGIPLGTLLQSLLTESGQGVRP
jgi:hypothetical protein